MVIEMFNENTMIDNATQITRGQVKIMQNDALKRADFKELARLRVILRLMSDD